MMKGLVKRLLSRKWQVLTKKSRKVLPQDSKYPGVYFLAYSDGNLTDQPIRLKDVYYVGMSNSKGGVRARLGQFLDAIDKGSGHSAGNRFFQEEGKEVPFSKFSGRTKFYISYH